MELTVSSKARNDEEVGPCVILGLKQQEQRRFLGVKT